MEQCKEVGEALKTIFKRLQEITPDECTDTSREYGCLYCKHYIKEEGYNQQWGMYQFYNCYCNKGIKEKYYSIIDSSKCNSYEHGDNILVYMSDKEKEDIRNSYFK